MNWATFSSFVQDSQYPTDVAAITSVAERISRTAKAPNACSKAPPKAAPSIRRAPRGSTASVADPAEEAELSASPAPSMAAPIVKTPQKLFSKPLLLQPYTYKQP